MMRVGKRGLNLAANAAVTAAAKVMQHLHYKHGLTFCDILEFHSTVAVMLVSTLGISYVS